ncbi:Shedu anti-phage system protein SduA domain-containing protein [Gordonia soli]|uniref:Shedu protein SduA C-terminal domain-containing protein n=1 Tax=Gordonia soli NBRC 108243 TaxID=1223545 RepID=M0QJA5_9ACTN|nr:Shedu anti-phage system protein SduA domain-containing protein [Gordonia soli]GAC67507.1 hypothetical protein GS4_08_00920 [Gordonia soli NBRC 108243]
MTDEETLKASLRRWIRGSSNPRVLWRDGIGLKARGKSFKSATLSYFGNNPESPSGRELTLVEVPREEFGPGYDFENATTTFKLRDNEIEVLQKFLNGLLADEGHYVRVGDKSVADALADSFIQSGQNDRTLMNIFAAVSKNPELAMMVSRQPEALALSSKITDENHKDVIDRLDEMARRESPAASEKEFQKLVEKNSWIFGGRFIEPIRRRSVTVLDELDVPLTAVDGSLHIVELKRSDINRLFVKHRNHWIVGKDIHEAVSQVENYLFALDSAGDNIRATLNLDVYRAIGTVVVGHLDQCTTDVTREEAYRAMRIYNSHLSRVRVLTYDQLIANARNAMALGVVGAGDAV